MTKVNVAGIDIRKKFFDVCMLAGDEHRQKQFSNDATGIKAAAQWLTKEVHCVMEVTGCYYMRLALYLQQHGFMVSVVNPLVIKRFSQMRLLRAKTDKADANMIAEYALSEQPEIWTPPQQYSVTLQQLDGISEQLSKQHTALSNQLEAFTQSSMMEKGTKQFLLKFLKQIREQQRRIEIKTNELIQKYHGEMIGCLTTIPGLGNKTAAMLIVITDGFKKFSSHKQLSAYVGISPRIFESGSSIRGKTKVCKMGMSRIRALLYLCAWSAKRCNRACKELYDRLLAKGKAKKQALIAVANKLLKQAFAIAASNEKYNVDYVKNICL
jgi:transposase